MTDYHCHLLPGIDDGPESIQDAIAMARLLMQAGYNTVYCTPHLIKGLYDSDNKSVRKAVLELQKVLNMEGICLQLLCGREYFLDNHFKDYMNDLMPLENSSYLLIEIPPYTYPGMVQDTISSILRMNYIPLLAHPERCELFHDHQKTTKTTKFIKFKKLLHYFKSNNLSDISSDNDNNSLLYWLIEKHCAFQGNLPSFHGAYGNQIQNTAVKFNNFGFYTHFGTDAHSPQCLQKIFSQTQSLSLPHAGT
jgi:protein-tyrosine phosphatase